MPGHSSLLAAIVALSVSLPAAGARADDASDVKGVISSQLDAFRTGDGPKAYSYAAPGIKAMFPSPDVFMSMVRSGYGVVADARNVTFGPMTVEGAGFRQDVLMNDAADQSFVASYTLERQADGSLKITSCRIRKGDDVSA